MIEGDRSSTHQQPHIAFSFFSFRQFLWWTILLKCFLLRVSFPTCVQLISSLVHNLLILGKETVPFKNNSFQIFLHVQNLSLNRSSLLNLYIKYYCTLAAFCVLFSKIWGGGHWLWPFTSVQKYNTHKCKLNFKYSLASKKQKLSFWE